MIMTGSDVVLKRNTVGPIFHLSDESLQVSHVVFFRGSYHKYTQNIKATQIHTHKNTPPDSQNKHPR